MNKFFVIMSVSVAVFVSSAVEGLCNPHHHGRGHGGPRFMPPPPPFGSCYNNSGPRPVVIPAPDVSGLLPRDNRYDNNFGYYQPRGHWENVVSYQTVMMTVTHQAVIEARWINGQLFQFVASPEWTETVPVQRSFIQRVWVND